MTPAARPQFTFMQAGIALLIACLRARRILRAARPIGLGKIHAVAADRGSQPAQAWHSIRMRWAASRCRELPEPAQANLLTA